MDIISFIDEQRKKMGGSKNVDLFLDSPDNLAHLVDTACSELPHPYPAYASWMVSHISKEYPDRLVDFHKQIIDTVLNSSNQSVLRNCTQTLNNLMLSDYKEGDLLDRLIKFIKDDGNKVALFVYSIYLLAKFTLKYPEIKQEIQAIIESKPKNMQAAMRVGIRNYLSKTAHI